MGVEALLAQSSVERLHERVVDRLAWPAEVERHAMLVGPAIERVRHELRAVVDPDPLGRAAHGNDSIERIGDLLAGDALVHHDGQRLAREHIEQRQRAQAPAVEQRVRHEVHRPDLVRHLAWMRSTRCAALTWRCGRLIRRFRPSSRYSRRTRLWFTMRPSRRSDT